MATINLGAIKFNWKGAYNNSTAYAVDDVVSSGGNSYVCIQASTGNAVGNATAYWNIMSSAGSNGTNGTNGTDVGTTLTTQGDILYRDGSGLQRLPKGTAGQVLQMNSGATAPEYATAGGGKVKSITTSLDNSQRVTSSSSYTEAANTLQLSVTPESASSKFLVSFDFTGGGSASSARYSYGIKRNTGGVSTFLGDGEVVRTHEVASAYSTENPMTINITDSPNTTAQVSYNVVVKAQSNNAYINTNGTAIGVLIEYV